MPAMLRKSGLKQLKKFKEFSKGDISSKLKDKTVTNTLDKKISTNEKLDADERYLSDDEIEAGYNNFVISEFSVDNIHDNGVVSGWITIEFPADEDDEEPGVESRTDHWIRYEKGGNIAFDSWYPEKTSQALNKFIKKGIKKEKLKRDAQKYNIL